MPTPSPRRSLPFTRPTRRAKPEWRLGSRRTTIAPCGASLVSRTDSVEPVGFPAPPNHHIKLYRAWLAITGADMQPMEYVRAICWMNGTTIEEIRVSRQRGRLLPIKKAIIRSTHHRFRKVLSYPRLGEIFGCDHTVILYHVGSTARGRKACMRPNKGDRSGSRLPEEKRAAIYEARKTTGRTMKAIAQEFGVSERTVSLIVREYRKLLEDLA